jgi:Serine dehydrogenase proteinase
VLGDVSRKALRQVEVLAGRLLERNVSPERAKDVAMLLSTGTWTHDHPLMPSDLEAMGLPVKVGVPPEERELMELYPQPRGRQSAVEYFPGTPMAPGMPPGRERPRPARRERSGSPPRA